MQQDCRAQARQKSILLAEFIFGGPCTKTAAARAMYHEGSRWCIKTDPNQPKFQPWNRTWSHDLQRDYETGHETDHETGHETASCKVTMKPGPKNIFYKRPWNRPWNRSMKPDPLRKFSAIYIYIYILTHFMDSSSRVHWQVCSNPPRA